MLTTIEEICGRLVQSLDPESIILFGSRARGTHGRSSDIDLLIVKNGDGRPVDRRIEAERALTDRSVPLDLFVYTPKEIRLLFSIGSPFIQEVVDTGKVLYMRKATEQWLRDAGEELDSAVILQKHRKYKGVCYHSQQCVEECLKALILERGEMPEKTHDILDLRVHVEKVGWELRMEMEDAIFLNSIYKGRYPSEEGLLPYGEPSREDAKHALGAATRIFKKAHETLSSTNV